MSKIGNEIRLKRKQSVLTQKELAKEAGVNIGSLGNIERNGDNFTLRVLKKVCTALGYDLKFKLVKK